MSNRWTEGSPLSVDAHFHEPNHMPPFPTGQPASSSASFPLQIPEKEQYGFEPSQAFESPKSIPATPFIVPDQTPMSPVRAATQGRGRTFSSSSVVDINNIPITYTPTTHRISKAKKGKKVHVCEFGCGKVFTRAEHRKRHEANHRTEPLFRCHIEECQKPFQRADLLARHLERQHSIIESPPLETKRRRTLSSASSAVASSVSASPNPSSVPTAVPLQQPGSSHVDNSSSTYPLSLDTFLGSSGPTSFSQSMPSWSEAYQLSNSMPLPILTPDLGYGGVASATQSPIYSPDSCYSPTPERQSHFSPHPFYARSERPVFTYASDVPAPAMSEPLGPLQSWPISGGYPAFGGLGIEFEGISPLPVGQANSNTLPNLDPGLGLDFRSAESPHSGELVSGRLVNVDLETIQFYDGCYWEKFDPIFPIIHRSTYISTETPTFLSAMILAIGAQLSGRLESLFHSALWLSFASRYVATLVPSRITRVTKVSTLQGVFLYEYLALYRSNGPGVHRSLLFSALLSELLSAYHEDKPHSAFAVNSLPSKPTLDLLQKAYGDWVEIESRNRILLACFILEVHRKLLFDQSLNQSISSSGTSNLPTPSSQAAWTTTNLADWQSIVTSTTTARPSSPFLFQKLLNLTRRALRGQQDLSIENVFIIAPTLQLARRAPISSLIVTAAASWLFERKATLASWSAAQRYIRGWVGSPDGAIATWWAGKSLMAYFKSQTSADLRQSPFFGLETEWCLYLSAIVIWAFTLPPQTKSGVLSRAQSYSPVRSPGPKRARTHPLTQVESVSPPPLPQATTISAEHLAVPTSVSSRQQSQSPTNASISSLVPPSTPLTSYSETTAGSAHILMKRDGSSDPTHFVPPSVLIERVMVAAATSTASTAMTPFAAQEGKLVSVLSRLDTPTWHGVVNLRGTGGAEPVLIAVRNVIASGTELGNAALGGVQLKGSKLRQAERVLDRLIDGRGEIVTHVP